MSRIKLCWTSGVGLLVFTFLLLNIQYSYSADNEKGVRDAAEQFYAALNTLFKGDAGPMTEVWSHADDVTYMGPTGGMLVGWEEVGNTWLEQANLKLGGEIKSEEMHVTAGETIGITVNYERGTNYPDGKPQKVNIRATNVFRLEDGKWKMIGHHTDMIPWLEEKAESP
jgi:ketosteroid isomerase-like protein